MVRCPNCDQETSGDYCQWCKYPLSSGIPWQEEVIMDKVVAKPTWALAWGLFWRYTIIYSLFSLVIGAIIVGFMLALGVTILPFIEDIWTF